jgi:hypothetical protein
MIEIVLRLRAVLPCSDDGDPIPAFAAHDFSHPRRLRNRRDAGICKKGHGHSLLRGLPVIRPDGSRWLETPPMYQPKAELAGDQQPMFLLE